MSEAPSLRDVIEAAAAGEEPPESAVSETAAPPAATEEKQPVAAPEASAEPSSDGAPKRDESGRFAKSGDQPHTAASETAQPAGAEPQATETIRPPASLPAALKAEFATLPKPWQEAIAKIEESVGTAKAEWGGKGERLNRLDEVLAPRKDKLALAGVDEVQAIRQLFAAQDALEANPVQALHYLARSYGVDLRQVAAQATGGQQPQQAQINPDLAPIYQQLQTLTQAWQQQTEQSETAKLTEAETEISRFAADPKHLYFANVKEEMGRLIGTGRAKDLAEAYEMATWADPEIRPLLLKAQQPQPQPDPQAQQRAKANAAAQAAGSVTGGPGGAAGGAVGGSKGSLRADIEAAVASQGGRVG